MIWKRGNLKSRMIVDILADLVIEILDKRGY